MTDAKANILLVDDHAENLLALETVLADLDQNLVKAHSSAEALRCVLNRDFAVILLDVQMPEMDGFEAATLIRTRERSQHTPIIFLTAIGKTDPDVFRGYSVGAVDYLFKPFIPEILKSKVVVFVELFKMRERVRRQAEQLSMFNLKLEQEIAERQRAEAVIQRHSSELQAANKELEAFSYSVSHDLRAPLRHINGFAELLQKESASRLDDKGTRYLKMIVDSAKHMGRLIDDLLAFSRIGRTELRMAPVKLDHVVKEALQDLQPDIDKRHIAWTVHALPEVLGDHALLRQVFVNLISNAVKYSATRDMAAIEIGSLQDASGGEAIMFVRDNGVGFDMQYAHKLFGVFQRLHGSKEFEGTGIGLANVRQIIARHGGRTWAEGTPDKGAVFFVSLPRRSTP